MSSYISLEKQHKGALTAILIEAFGTDESGVDDWIARSCLEDWRGLIDAQGELSSCLVRVPMGQWLQGRLVPASGVAGVAVSCEHRGQGCGRQLLTQYLQEIHDSGPPVSILYASTTHFYRSLGYERAGTRYMAKAQVRDLVYQSSPGQIRRIKTENDFLAIKKLYEEETPWHGKTHRETYLWNRVRQGLGRDSEGFAIICDGKLEGYFYALPSPRTFDARTLTLTDILLTTPEAVDTFFSYIAQQRALFAEVHWADFPSSPLLMKVTERWSYSLEVAEQWFMRLVRLKDALEARGYPKHLKAELHFQTEDPLLPDNSGSWVLKIENGSGTVEPGGEGRLRLSIGGFASLYTGFACPRDLCLSGALVGPREDFPLLRAAFWNPPHMSETF